MPRTFYSTLYIRGLPRYVKDRFKAYCASRGVTMTQLIEEMLTEKIKGFDKLDISGGDKGKFARRPPITGNVK